MSQEDFNVHHTITYRILGGDGNGWEFSCESCGYRARYILCDDRSQYRLEIIDAGDPFSRHTSQSAATASVDPYSYASRPADELYTAEQANLDEPLFEEEAWLTPDLRKKLKRILDRLDD